MMMSSQGTYSPAKAKILPLFAASFGNIIWGFSYLFTRMAQSVAAPDVLLAIRFTLAFLLMNLLLPFQRGALRPKGKNLRPVLLLSVLEPLYFFFETYGVYYSNSTFAGVVLAIVPAISMLAAAIFLKEYPSRRQAFFCLLPILGVIVITISGSSMGIVRPLGLILLLCACFNSAFYRILNRKASQDFSPFARTYAVLLVSCIVFVIVSLIRTGGRLQVYWDALSNPSFLLPTLVLSVFCSVVANMVVNYAASRLSVTVLSIYSALMTICSMFAGVVFLHEPLTLLSLFGSVLILIGIWQVNRPQKASASS